MNRSETADSSEILHALRGLSHDMGAAHFMLAHSFGRLKKLLEDSQAKNTSQEEVHLCISQVEACVNASKGYLDDVIRLSTSGTADMEPEPVDVAAVLEDVLLEQAPLIDEREVQIQVCSPLPIVWCTAISLKRVLTNLIRNAVLHGCDSEQPGVSVQRSDPPDGDDSMAAVRIHDNGLGIDSRRHREVFLPGRRLSEAEASGSGWGLPTARRIVERFGGGLVLDTECTQGTAFIVALPDASDAVEPHNEVEPVEAGRRWRLQLDARHKGPLRHGHSQLSNVESRMPNAE